MYIHDTCSLLLQQRHFVASIISLSYDRLFYEPGNSDKVQRLWNLVLYMSKEYERVQHVTSQSTTCPWLCCNESQYNADSILWLKSSSQSAPMKFRWFMLRRCTQCHVIAAECGLVWSGHGEKCVGSGFFLAGLRGELWRVWTLWFYYNVKLSLNRPGLMADATQHCVHTHTDIHAIKNDLSCLVVSSEPEKNAGHSEHIFHYH